MKMLIERYSMETCGAQMVLLHNFARVAAAKSQAKCAICCCEAGRRNGNVLTGKVNWYKMELELDNDWLKEEL